MKKIHLLIFATLLSYISNAQTVMPLDTILKTPHKFQYKQLIIPALLISYGAVGIESDQLKFVNSQINEEITEHIDDKITIDDFSQYTPAASVYVLNAIGIRGRHNIKDQTVILATSYLIMTSAVFGLKSATKVMRPDGRSANSFPSGHTATAFAGAEFLMQEYKDVSIWIGITGYGVATGTGLFRLYNKRHWLTDVAAGAGIGILSTKLAYWVNPYINKKIFPKPHNKTSSLIVPIYDGRYVGLSFSSQF